MCFVKTREAKKRCSWEDLKDQGLIKTKAPTLMLFGPDLQKKS